MSATIVREEAQREGVAVTRFIIKRGELQRTVDVEKAEPRRVLGWADNRGEKATILKTARLPYWRLNNTGDESYLAQLGLPAR